MLFKKLHYSTILCIFLCFIIIENLHGAKHKSLEQAGDILQFAIPTVAFGATLRIKDYAGSQEFAWGLAATGVTAYGLKYLVNEKRPNHGSYSFPSGHVAIAFFGSGFIHKRYGLKYAFLAYGAALFVGYTRVNLKEHWVHDVVGGAAIGLLYSYLLTTPYKPGKFRIYPTLIPKGAALCCEKEF